MKPRSGAMQAMVEKKLVGGGRISPRKVPKIKCHRTHGQRRANDRYRRTFVVYEQQKNEAMAT